MKNKLKKLEDILNGYGRMLVALSGGVDSAFLLIFAHKLWGDDRVSALTATGPHFASDETEYAGSLCNALGISHKFLDVSDILPVIEDNPSDRCYHCKREIFSTLKLHADMTGSVLADGTNLDDMDDYRPGYKALQELGIANPLKDAGLTKEEIREALKNIAGENKHIQNAFMVPVSETRSISLWEKPAFACLASRIPYGEKITERKLNAIYAAEKALRSMGINQVRVRHHGDVARIEVLPEERKRFYDEVFMNKVNTTVKNCGFKFAALDLGGYKMGNLNKKFSTEDTDQNYSFEDLLEIISILRSPDGCPWDIKQTHESLKECLTEEAGEVIEAIDNKDDVNLCEELGDLLLQVVMHAQIASEEGRFTMSDIIQGISAKMIRRHPHVFGDEKVSSVDEGLNLWNKIKESEKGSL